MSMIDAIPLLAGAGADGYQISRSVRLRSSASANFTRTPSVSGNMKTWTWSAWVKRGSLSQAGTIWGSNFASGGFGMAFGNYGGAGVSPEIIGVTLYAVGTVTTSAVFRDPSAWYHIVARFDSTQATQANRFRLYVNGVQQTLSAALNVTLNADYHINASGRLHTLGGEAAYYNDCYLTEVNHVDGQSLDPSSFGETNSVTGVWQPKRYAGTYGTNGFYLPFSDNASLTRLGFDQRSSATVYANGWRNSFNGSASLTAATNAAFAIGTNNFTIEAWIKPTSQAGQIIFVASNGIQVGYQNTTTWGLCQANVAWQLTTTTVPTLNAWNHIVVVRSGTGANQTAIFLNGTRVAQGTISTSYAQNSCVVGSGIIGDLTNVRLVNGTAIYDPTQTTLTVPTAPLSNVANTAILTCQNETFVDNSSNAFSLTNSATTSARDSTFNTCNDWTPSTGISITAGVTYDSMLDVPTLYADGGNGRGNYAVVNPLFRNASMITDGNLYFNKSTIGWATGQATIPLPASKTYFEATAVLIGGANSGVFIGVATASAAQDTYQVANQWSFGGTGGTLKLYNQTSLVTPSGSSAAGDIFQVAYDGATGYLWFGKNNTWYDSAGGTTGNPSTGANPTMTLTAGTEIFPCAICYANALKFTFGQQPFTYTPPTGFKALNTLNLPTPTILKGNQYFDAVTYAGSASQQTITTSLIGLDLAWIKNRTAARDHVLVDTVRGGSPLLTLYSDLTALEDNSSPNYNPTSFTTSGIVLGGAKLGINNAGENFVLWGWKEGATQGFDIVTYTGNGTSQNISHSLGVAPRLIIVKNRATVSNWCVWHGSFVTASNTDYLFLQTTGAKGGSGSLNFWNNTPPTDSVFTVGSDSNTNNSGQSNVAYLFAAVAGYSKFGSYVGTSTSDGTFVYLGFRPRWIMIKNISIGTAGQSDWVIYDTSRGTSNVVPMYLLADLPNGEATSAGNEYIDILSNGFKLRGSSNYTNSSSYTYIYAAFAENPFKLSLAR